MALLIFVLTLGISQVINCAPNYAKQSFDENILLKLVTSKCPEFAEHIMVKTCSNTTTVDVINITDTNVNNVLCTIYFYNMLKFIDKHKTCDSLDISRDNSDLKICEDPAFLILNQTYTEDQLKSLNFRCVKLCINWNNTINPMCSVAYHYHDAYLKNINVTDKETLDQNLVIQSNDDSYKSITQNSTSDKPVNPLQNQLNKQGSAINGINSGTNVEIVTNKTENSVVGLENNKQKEKLHEFKEDSDTTITPKTKKPNNEDLNDKQNQDITKQDVVPDKKQNVVPDVKPADDNVVEIIPTKESPLIENGDDVEGPSIVEEEEESTYDNQEQESSRNGVGKMEKPNTLVEDNPVSNINTDVDGESYFFSYFMVVCILFVMGYVFYHNRAKVMAMVIEGKRNKRQSRSRRPNSANYHKLDSNLEEALTSSCNKNSNQIIY